MATEEINPNPNVQEENSIDDHESEETLSLCDLPIHTDQDHYEDDSCKKLHQSSSISSSSSSSSSSWPFSSDDQDLFEFYSEEWNIKTSPTFNKANPPPSENIIFCGKMIPSHPTNQKPISKSTQKQKTKNIIPHSQEKRSLGKSRSGGSKGGEKNMNKVLVPRESIFTSLVKKRWYLILLGLPPKIPSDQTELMTDIKNRQRRQAPSTFFPSDGGGEEAAIRRKNDYGLWRLIKEACCFGGQLMQTSVL